MSVGTMGSATAAPPASAHLRQLVATIPWSRIARGGGRGFALGLLFATLLAGAMAGQAFHTRVPMLDGVIGMAFVIGPLLLLNLVLWIPTAIAARLLTAIARRLDPQRARVALAPAPFLRFLGRPLVATTIGIPVMVWGSTDGSPLSIFHALFFSEILIATGAVVGFLLGMAWGARPLWAHGWLRAGSLMAAAAAVGMAFLVGAWAVLPGDGDTIAVESPAALAAIAPLDLPDPGARGPFAVGAATYGSGIGPRPEFAADADWTTATFDASAALPARAGIERFYSEWLWGFGASRLPVNGLVWYPIDAPGRLPLVLIVHGNHDAGEFSDPGYADLARHLASRGMIAVSVDENFLNGDPFTDFEGVEQPVRAWLLLRHLEEFRTWDQQAGHPLVGRVDLDRVALIGHSRGGEAAAVAAMLEADESLVLRGLPSVPRGFGIRAVVAIAPSDRQYVGPGAPVHLTDVDYLVMQGGHDGDVVAFIGLKAYHRVTYTGTGDHLKVALFSERANHGRFNTVWDIGDAGMLSSWLLDRGSILSMSEQQQLARVAVGAFLARSLQGDLRYDAFFREPRAGREWLPEDMLLSHWASSDRVAAGADPGITTAGASEPAVEGFSRIVRRDPMLRDGSTQGDAAAWLRWETPASYRVPVGEATRSHVSRDDALVFSLASAGEPGESLDPIVELHFQSGASTAVRLSDVAPVRPLFATDLWKVDWLGARYVPTETVASPVERFLQTYCIPLAAFASPVTPPGGGPAGLDAITFRFEGAGSAFLDDIGFEPAVTSQPAAAREPSGGD